MNVSYCVYLIFSIVVKKCENIYHLERNECFEFITIWQRLHILEYKSCRRDSLSSENNSCWIQIIMLWKSSSCSLFLDLRVDRSSWTSKFIPPIWEAHEWRVCIELYVMYVVYVIYIINVMYVINDMDFMYVRYVMYVMHVMYVMYSI